MFSQIKDRKHIVQNFHSVAKVMFGMGLRGAGGVKNFSVGICDGTPSTARSSLILQEDFTSLGQWEAIWQMKFNVALTRNVRLIRLRKFRGQQPAGPAGGGETQVVSAKCLMSLNGHLLRTRVTSPLCFSFTRFIVDRSSSVY